MPVLKLEAKPAPVGDFTVLRVIPQRALRFVGPFCFLDHMGPHTSIGVVDGGVAPHPHIGLATVTYLFDGAILHRDSLGTEQLITPGDVNWMTAGRGIVHSERTPPSLIGKSSTMHGLQFWVALPIKSADESAGAMDHEEGPPSFQHAPRSSLPFEKKDGVSLRVVLGEWKKQRSPVKIASPLTLVVAELDAGAELELDPLHPERALYVAEGNVTLDAESLSRGEVASLVPGEAHTVTAITPAKVAFMAGAALDGPRSLLWNFVSSRRELLNKAKEDWIAGRFPNVPGDAGPRVPWPESK
ncbi:MAG: pirin family protein [Archangium sp.]|nr:pirin family protein [Archangium sp.]